MLLGSEDVQNNVISYFYTPVFRRDVLWYGDVRLSVHPSVRVSGVSVRQSQFSPTCFDILSWNFICHFFLINIRSRSRLCPFWNLKYWKYTVFRSFLLHTLTYCAEILHMTLLCCTTDQVWVSLTCFNFCGSYAPSGTKNTGNTRFSALFSYMLWHIELKFCIWLCFTVLQINLECHQFASIFLWELCPFWNLKYWKYTVFRSFLLHTLTYCAEILHMTLLYYRSSLSVINLLQFLWELCPFWN